MRSPDTGGIDAHEALRRATRRERATRHAVPGCWIASRWSQALAKVEAADRRLRVGKGTASGRRAASSPALGSRLSRSRGPAQRRKPAAGRSPSGRRRGWPHDDRIDRPRRRDAGATLRSRLAHARRPRLASPGPALRRLVVVVLDRAGRGRYRTEPGRCRLGLDPSVAGRCRHARARDPGRGPGGWPAGSARSAGSGGVGPILDPVRRAVGDDRPGRRPDWLPPGAGLI